MTKNETENLEHFKKKLEEELTLLTAELKSVGRTKPDNPSDWEAKPSDSSARVADPNVKADAFEDYEENVGILNELEIRYNNVKKALKKIESGTYGVCEIGGEKIEQERLEANPAATTCKKHLK